MLRRWPALVALAFIGPDVIAAALGNASGSAEDLGDLLGQTLPMLALVYLLMAKIGNRRFTWPIVAVVVACVVVIKMSGAVAPSAVLIGASLLLLVWVSLNGQLGRSGALRLQAIGVAFFCGLAVTGLVIDPQMGTYVIAAGWLLHGVWDFVHLWRDRVVSRSFAELCGVIDVLIAIQLVLM
ncbi:hypothetical protein ACFWB0_05740 [Rhodococcus sp. NPDC060086]|uniref:hypothetical protein n=1 Tax=unclassified Rhodococcus (in: high G+C Gram-positive bacteria) TaxID=192944 RepID=UPI0036629178